VLVLHFLENIQWQLSTIINANENLTRNISYLANQNRLLSEISAKGNCKPKEQQLVLRRSPVSWLSCLWLWKFRKAQDIACFL